MRMLNRRLWFLGEVSGEFFSLLPALIVLILTIAWHSRWPRYEIPPEKIAYRIDRDIQCRDGDPLFLDVHVSGYIDGYATFITPHGQFEIQPGNVDLRTGGDYYDKAAQLEYVPDNVTEGQLTVKYKFSTI
jgi:hypothetical protein